MKILINAYNLKIAGGLNVALNFIQQLKHYPEDDFFVLAPKNCGYETFEAVNIKIITIPEILQRYILRFYLDRVWIISQIRTLKPDVIFSMGNYALPAKVKQGLLFHFPYLIYPADRKHNLPLKDQLILIVQYLTFRSRLKYVNLVFPQTTVAGNRLKKYYGENLNIYPVHNAYTKLKDEKNTGGQSLLHLPKEYKHLVCLTKYYTHKNIEILLDVAKLLKEHNSSIRIITTVETSQHRLAKRFIDTIRQNQLEFYLLNIGHVSMFNIPQLYHETDGLILPTYLESFTATYVDAMYFRKPIFTSDMDFAHEICGDIAYYFNPADPLDIFNVITAAFGKPDEIIAKVEAGSLRVAEFPDWEKVTETYIRELKRLKL